MFPGSVELFASSNQGGQHLGARLAEPFQPIRRRMVPSFQGIVHLLSLQRTPAHLDVFVRDDLVQGLRYRLQLFFRVFHVIYPVEFKGDCITGQGAQVI